ncbi:branched-chain amino acid ABC transporter permease [Nitratireductor aestuarii]|uniref:Branched-chain amino acid ABC transporter permease n=1 Tax=Nitratireductor aestuarii TaxID=1735103 RepID=A0A916RXB8_9HYPH|nr:branched-chain amino acid ABC transporter permease [Nitratireductor aestuarii]GGA75368.1 branched-chain amino acid ABC transporter permease [Nitratireductor aestuarii]
MSSSVAERHSGREQALTLSQINRVLFVAAAVIIAAMPYLTNSGLLYLVGTTLILAVYSVGWNFLFSWAGLASFGSGGLFCIGAYVSAVALRAGWEQYFLLVIVVATLAGAAVAFLVGFVALRRTSGIFLAILTLSLAELLRHTLMHTRWLGSEDGLPNITRPTVSFIFFELNLKSGPAYYWFICAFAVVMLGICWWLSHGPLGRRLQAVRYDIERASFVGIDVHRNRLLAFVISGAVAACAGAVYAPWAQIVTPELSGMIRSTQPILFTLLGGLHSFWGPVVGAFAFMGIDYATRTLIGIQEIITGGILLGVILVFRGGIVGSWNALLARIFPGRGEQ